MKNFELTAFLRAILFMQFAVQVQAISNAQHKPCVNSEMKEPDKAISRDGSNNGISYVNLAKDDFSYLNITALNGRDFVDNMPECSLACLDTPSCFSFNVGATLDVNNRFPCELLPSDKYNNSDKFIPSYTFHHFSIATPCSSWPCKNKGKCLPLYRENNYKCLCKGFKGKNCENDIDECSSANECHQNATCNNTKGSYNCTCKDGFEGDGKNCTDIDECSIENECHQNATCTNTKGSYNCTCKDGFEGDGKNCTDINECSTKNECHQNASCKNTKGSYICTCQGGLEGDGKYCTGPECSSYIVNKETDRSVLFVNNGSSHRKCDTPLAAGWYRFNSTAGSKMPTNCTQEDRCNTIATGWLNGINPSPQEGIVTRTVCFSWKSDCCFWQKSIRVRNCGLFYVYYLTSTDGCYYRYCVTN
ncbi:uromodulin-like isoform X3 [Acropora millepora]|uniref:uromodulin-like isoform X3 n=1 Tax=Acropora millepora TaxID=45264 RepID=UPI001CF272B6|nr:uromodulin-like isoform X3 [Acropora millepora]